MSINIKIAKAYWCEPGKTGLKMISIFNITVSGILLKIEEAEKIYTLIKNKVQNTLKFGIIKKI